MKRKIYKGGVDNYPLWWYGQSRRLQNFGDRTNFLIPHGAVFKGNGYYFNSANSDYMEDIYGRHLVAEGTNGLWSQLYLTNSDVPPCGSLVGTGTVFDLPLSQSPLVTGKIILYPEYCPNLSILHCGGNKLSILDVSQMILLGKLACDDNILSILDVSHLSLLTVLYCPYNLIPILDTSQMSLLCTFYCNNNYISALDVCNNTQILMLKCQHNQMNSAAVDKVLMDADTWGTSDGTLDISSNAVPGTDGTTAKNNLVNRGWSVTVDS